MEGGKAERPVSSSRTSRPCISSGNSGLRGGEGATFDDGLLDVEFVREIAASMRSPRRFLRTTTSIGSRPRPPDPSTSAPRRAASLFV
jgi:hypothetical protein